MTVGILVITHQGIGDALLRTAENTFRRTFDHVGLLGIPLDGDPGAFVKLAIEKARGLNTGAGVLILGDLVGATPGNIAASTTEALEHKAQLVCGINLPMLLRVINYAQKPLEELADIAVQGGMSGITSWPDCQRSL